MKAQRHAVVNVKRSVVSTETAGYNVVSVVLRIAVVFSVGKTPLADIAIPLANDKAPRNVKFILRRRNLKS